MGFTKPLFQICLTVCPNRYNTLVDAVLEIAGQRTQEKKESYDGLIIQALHNCIKRPAAHYKIPTAEVTEMFNTLWQGEKPKNEKSLGRRLKALGVCTSTRSGRSMITMSRGELQTILKQYGFNSEPPENNSINSRETINTSTYSPEFQFEPKNETPETQGNSEINVPVNSDSFELPELSEFNFRGETEQNLREVEI